jgi:hypothetical protein
MTPTGTGGGTAAAGGGSSAGGGAAGGSTNQPFTWAGTWTVELSYTARCNFGGVSMQQRANMHSVTLQVEGTNSSLTGSAQGMTYEMTGTGSDTRLSLSGTFPMRDHNGQSASGSNRTQVTFDVTRMGEGGSGSVQATFDGSSGFRCEVQGGSVVLRR